ncbi:MAG: HAD hydrolase-like protein [Vicinamibacteria bacterium]|jgi:phosphoglycolate phosphatase-like HAD superfamily hydrolase|nr:HAD hydrolase-like protein [Vicinamibacteria bacterium]
MEPRLVLFDIDGTLLSASHVFRVALTEALTGVFGAAGPIPTFDFSGKTDPQIVRELMRAAGISDAEIDLGLKPALDEYERRLIPLLTEDHVIAKPGIAALLAELEAHPAVTLGLLTGNIESCARAKLAPLGWNVYFPFGAYGSDAEDRARLPAVAVERAHAHNGRRFAGKRVVVVGDSIHDVRCGRHLGVRAVAVASGRTNRAQLAAEQPDALCDDFSDTQAALRAILGGD